MYIKKVHIHSFKNWTGEVECFPKTLFMGPNGAGKSRILEAIALAVTGDDRNEFGLPVKRVVDIINNRAPKDCTSIQTGVQFDNEFSILREFTLTKQDTGKQIPRCYPSMNEKSVKEVNERIQKETGLFPEMYNVYPILSKNPTQLREYFLGLCESKEWSWIRFMKELKEKIGNTEIDDSIISNMESLFDAEAPVETNFQKILNYLHSQFTERNKEVKLSEGASATISDLSTSYSQTTIEELGKDIEIKKTLKNQVFESITKTQTKLEQIGLLEQGLGEPPKGDVESINGMIEMLQGSIVSTQEPENACEKLNKAITEIKIQTKEIDRDNSILRNELAGLRVFRDQKKCPTCHQSLDKILPEIEKREDTLTEKIQDNDKLLDFLGKEISETSTRLDKAYATRRKITANNDFIEKQIKDLKAQLKTIASAKTDKEKIEAMKKEIEGVDISHLMDQTKELDKEIKVLEKELERQKTAKAHLEGFRKAVDAKQKSAELLEQIKVLQRALGYKGIAGQILRNSITPFVDNMNKLLKEIDPDFIGDIGFESVSGREVFNLLFNDISSKSISTGQRALFLTALQISLLLSREDIQYKCAFCDNLEAIDDLEEFGRRRQRFVETICSFVDDGVINQFIGASSSPVACENCHIINL